MSEPLPFASRSDWHFRWCVTKTYGRLHRVVAGDKIDDWFVGVKNGRTACGLTGDFYMPGVCSRMGRERCWRCCQALGVAYGRGAPFNSNVWEPGEGPAARAS